MVLRTGEISSVEGDPPPQVEEPYKPVSLRTRKAQDIFGKLEQSRWVERGYKILIMSHIWVVLFLFAWYLPICRPCSRPACVLDVCLFCVYRDWKIT